MLREIQQGIMKAVRKEYPDCDDFLVDIDPARNVFDVCVLRTVVDDEPIDLNEINIERGKDYRSRLRLRRQSSLQA